MSAIKLSSTSAGLLGLLSLRSWSSYELTAQVRRSLKFVLPRAESALYAEQRRLATAGLVTFDTETQGRRPRKVYRLAARGQQALQAWLRDPVAEPHIEMEPLLRLLFADLGTKDDLHSALDTLEAWAHRHLAEGRAICAGYLEGEAPFPERLHLSALFADYYHGLYIHTLTWIDTARSEIATWPSTDAVGLTPGTRSTLERVATGRPEILTPGEDHHTQPHQR